MNRILQLVQAARQIEQVAQLMKLHIQASKRYADDQRYEPLAEMPYSGWPPEQERSWKHDA